MLLDLIEKCKEFFDNFHSKFLHSLNTRENLYEQFKKNQELRQEEEKNKIEAQKKQNQRLEQIHMMDESQEETLRKQWFSHREKQIETYEESEIPEEYSIGCELIPVKDLFMVQFDTIDS
jgi:hypothetical protein